MPLFEFHCNACGKDVEVLVRTSDWKGTACPACGSTRLVKKLSVFAAPSAPDRGEDAPMPCGMPPGAGGCCGGACGLN